MAERHPDLGQRLVVALVRGVHGLHGAVRIEVLTDRPDDRFRPGMILHREGSDDALTIASAEPVADGPGWRVRFREVATRDAADALRGAYLETIVHPVGELARGEVYWHEVVGVTVKGLDGAELGTVTDVYRVAENEVYVVAGGPYGTFDLPAVRAFIRIFAPRRGEIVIDPDALDLRPPRARPSGEDRPRAPRRISRRRRPAETGPGASHVPPEGAPDADPGPPETSGPRPSST